MIYRYSINVSCFAPNLNLPIFIHNLAVNMGITGYVRCIRRGYAAVIDCSEITRDLFVYKIEKESFFSGCIMGVSYRVINSEERFTQFTIKGDSNNCNSSGVEINEFSNDIFDVYKLQLSNGIIVKGIYDIEHLIADDINNDKLVALSSFGGYNIICNPKSKLAINNLRSVKGSYRKPFTVMFRDIDSLKRYASPTDAECRELKLPSHPIVIVKRYESSFNLSTNEYHTISAILAYLPIHKRVFDACNTECLIFTSGNIMGKDTVFDRDEGRRFFKRHNISLLYDPWGIDIIENNSISIFADGDRRVILRKSSGDSPYNLPLNYNCANILALGDDTNATLGFGHSNGVVLSHNLGSITNNSDATHFKRTLKYFEESLGVTSKCVVCDTNPYYFTTKFAEFIAINNNLKIILVNHHHAHAAAIMAEHGISDKTLSLSLDCVSYGYKNCFWGGEIILCDFIGFKVIGGIESINIPLCEGSLPNPWIMAISYIDAIYKSSHKYPTQFFSRVGADKIYSVERGLRNEKLTVKYAGVGGLFYAVAALLGICYKNDYEYEAIIKLEQCCCEGVNRRYPINRHDILNIKLLFDGVIFDIENGVDKGVISATFHNTIAYMFSLAVKRAAAKVGVSKVILCGEMFQNKILLALFINILKSDGIEAILPKKLPSNNSALGVGQILIASRIFN